MQFVGVCWITRTVHIALPSCFTKLLYQAALLYQALPSCLTKLLYQAALPPAASLYQSELLSTGCVTCYLRKDKWVWVGEVQIDWQLTSPHDFTAAASKRHELCLCSAQRNNLRKSMKPQSFACYSCHQPSWNRQKLEFHRVHKARDLAATLCELSPFDVYRVKLLIE